MKKAIIIGIVSMLALTGCKSQTIEPSSSLEEFFKQSLDENIKDISLKDSKKALKEFEYEQEDTKYSKQEKEEFNKEFRTELDDYSDHIFKDKEKNELNIYFNEGKKEVKHIAYVENNENTSKRMAYVNDMTMVDINTSDLNSQHEMLKRLNLSPDSNNIVDLYIRVVDIMNENTKIKIEDIIEILKLDYTNSYEAEWDTPRDIYTFTKLDENLYIEIIVEEDMVTNAKLNFGMSENANYSISISTDNKDRYITESDQEEFNTNISIINSSGENDDEESFTEVSEKEKASNKELFEFVYNGKEVTYYSKDYNTNEIEIIEGRYNAEEQAYVVSPNQDRIIEEGLYYEGIKLFKTRLKKDEHIRLEFRTEDKNELGKESVVSMEDLSNGEIILVETVVFKNKNILETPKVEKDGEYAIIFGIENMDAHNVKAYAIKK